MDTKKKTDLLETLMEQSGCVYLSDLHTPNYAQAVRTAVENIDAAAFELRIWLEAASYITAREARAETVEDARELLLCALREQAGAREN